MEPYHSLLIYVLKMIFKKGVAFVFTICAPASEGL
jgi:hypothetical protein